MCSVRVCACVFFVSCVCVCVCVFVSAPCCVVFRSVLFPLRVVAFHSASLRVVVCVSAPCAFVCLFPFVLLCFCAFGLRVCPFMFLCSLSCVVVVFGLRLVLFVLFLFLKCN